MDFLKAERVGPAKWRVLSIPFGGPFQGKDTDGARLMAAQQEAGRLRPGVISPRRQVPLHIVRPDYASSGVPSRNRFPDVKTPERLERQRRACRIAAEVLQFAGAQVKAGITTDAIENQTPVKLRMRPRAGD